MAPASRKTPTGDPTAQNQNELGTLSSATNDFDIVELDERIALDEIPPEVRQANLYLYSDAALAGRLAHYQREGLLERDPTLRAAWKAEAQRTQIEINRRKMYRQREADRVFEL